MILFFFILSGKEEKVCGVCAGGVSCCAESETVPISEMTSKELTESVIYVITIVDYFLLFGCAIFFIISLIISFFKKYKINKSTIIISLILEGFVLMMLLILLS